MKLFTKAHVCAEFAPKTFDNLMSPKLCCHLRHPKCKFQTSSNRRNPNRFLSLSSVVKNVCNCYASDCYFEFVVHGNFSIFRLLIGTNIDRHELQFSVDIQFLFSKELSRISQPNIHCENKTH